MNGHDHPGDEGSDRGEAAERARRRRLADVFGEVLPEQTDDDRSDQDGADQDGTDQWFQEQVPPHHG